MLAASRKVRPYSADKDRSGVYELWQATLGRVWPIDPSHFQQVLAGPWAAHFVAEQNGKIVGFVGTMSSNRQESAVGHLVVLIVAPEFQRQKIGTVLHARALDHLRAAGVRHVQLGSITPRFWPGVPGNLPAALNFFRAMGWDLSGTVYDLVRDLSSYAIPLRVSQRLEREQISLEVAARESIADVLAFEAREFPNWLMHFGRNAQLGDYQDLLVARDSSHSVVGTLIMYSPQSHPARTDVIWQSLLGNTAGAIGAVGVAESRRMRGIGIGLVAYASDLLKKRGVGNCFIDWVELTDFYARLGYEKWRSYQLSWREL